MTLIRLRRAYTNQELAYFFNISASAVSMIFITWVQFLYQQFSSLRNQMFPERHVFKKLSDTEMFQTFQKLACNCRFHGNLHANAYQFQETRQFVLELQKPSHTNFLLVLFRRVPLCIPPMLMKVPYLTKNCS